ncbi:MAG: SLBB domain-containing protein [Bacteroidales bacterium]|nr:SLBB domain-containing protein [Bacteroidales bacterium]
MISKLTTSALVMLLCMNVASYAQSAMSDQQVKEYVQSALASGKSQNEIAIELQAKGVTKEQALRLSSLYKSDSQTSFDKSVTNTLDDRSHTTSTTLETIPAPEKTSKRKSSSLNRYINASKADTTGIYRIDTKGDNRIPEVYGLDIFQDKTLNFAPSENIATPRNYRLGPGDEVIIDIFGANQTTLRSLISPEGSINVDVLGPLYLSGMTVEEANTYLKKRLSSIYGGLNRSGSGTDIRLSLGQIRTIQINILGEVQNKGTYTLSAFATVFHALYTAGGVVDPGSIRSIDVIRGGKNIATVDVYKFLISGSLEDNVRLEEGDVILVSPYREMVSAGGWVKRPMFFELKPGETIADLMTYAGGFAYGANEESVTVVRRSGKDYEVRTVDKADFSSFVLVDGDEVTAGQIRSRYKNKVSIEGPVYLPGVYELGEVNTVRELVEKAGGVMPEAFLGRAVLMREHEDRTLEVVSVNLERILAGTAPDVVLANNDILTISDKVKMRDVGDVSIWGYVKNPGTYTFADNMTVEDVIVLAGGLLDGASMARVDVSRRISDVTSITAGREIAHLFSFSIKDGLVQDGRDGFVLQPHDVVTVHKSPSYETQRFYKLSGEVNFPGSFIMSEREERLTDLISKAGGLSPYSYAKGARLIRQANDIERFQAEEMRRTFIDYKDTTSADSLLAGSYIVAVELDKAMANPGSEYDITLREGDELIVPQYTNTVRVMGAVMDPTVLTWKEGSSAGSYIKRCGGFAPKANKRHAFIVHMNGSSERYSRHASLQPGDEIVVPKKDKDEKPITPQQWAAMGSMAASLGTLATAIVYVVNSVK